MSTTEATSTDYSLVTLGRGTATHVAGWAADTTRCVNDWNLGRRVVRTHAAGTGRPTCKKCLASVDKVEAEQAAAVVVDEHYTARFNDDGEAEYGFAPRLDAVDEPAPTSTGRAAWIDQLHNWGDCTKHAATDPTVTARHCHCRLEIDALNSGRFLTCNQCDSYTVDGRREWTLVSRRPRGRFYRPVANVVPMTYAQARDLARTINTTATGDVIWYVPTQQKQAADALVNGGLAADRDNILHADGTRVPIRWDAEPQVEAPTTIERFVGTGDSRDVVVFVNDDLELGIAAGSVLYADDPDVVPFCPDCGSYPGTVEQENGKRLCLGCGRLLNTRPEIVAVGVPTMTLEWHGTAPRTYSARIDGTSRATVTDLGDGGWSWRVSRLAGPGSNRSWYPRTIYWGTSSSRDAAQAAAGDAAHRIMVEAANR